MSDSTFHALTVAENEFKQIVWDPLVKAGETALEGAVPVLAAPILKQLDEAALNALSDYFFEQLRLLLDLSAAQIVGAARAQVFTDASIQLKIIAHDKGVDSDEYKAALAKARANFSAFIRFNV